MRAFRQAHFGKLNASHFGKLNASHFDRLNDRNDRNDPLSTNTIAAQWGISTE